MAKKGGLELRGFTNADFDSSTKASRAGYYNESTEARAEVQDLKGPQAELDTSLLLTGLAETVG